MMTSRAKESKFFGASVFLGVLAVAEILFLIAPKFQHISSLLDIVVLMLTKINPALTDVLGVGAIAKVVVSFATIWLASIFALEAFSRSKDELSLWRNIFNDSCWRVPQGPQKYACTLIKWLITVLIAPFIVVWALIAALITGRSSIEVGYVVINPGIVIKYVKRLLLFALLIISAAILFFKLIG